MDAAMPKRIIWLRDQRRREATVQEPHFDPAAYLAGRTMAWDTVARGWRRWTDVVEAAARPLSERMVDLALAGIDRRRHGAVVLDLATGVGEPALTAARRLGPPGRVVATDLSPAMLDVARRRAETAGVTTVDWRVVDLEAPTLDLPADAFDGALCRWGLMFVLDRVGVLARTRAVLKPGGRFVAAVWGPPERVPWLALANDALRAELALVPPPVGQPSPFSLADPERLLDAFRQAGYHQPQAERLNLTFDLPEASAYAGFHREAGAGLFVAPTLATMLPERREAVWQAVADATRPYQTPDGRVRLDNECWLVWAER